MTPGRLPAATEFAVIGAGVAGLSTAWFLARAGHEVHILERAEPWGDASGANAGTLSLQVKILPVLALARKALDLWEQFAEALGGSVGFARPGGIRVATTDALTEELRRYSDLQQQAGLETEWLDHNAAHARAPWLGPGVQAGTWCREDGFSSPLLCGPILIDAVRRIAGLASGTAVESLVPHAGGFRLGTPNGSMFCRKLVIAAGPGTTRLCRMLGAELPLYADVNMLSVTEPAPKLLDCIITHIGGVLSLKQQFNGSILIGGGWQGRGSYSSGRKEIDHERLIQNLKLAAEVVPALRNLRIVRSWAGFEAVAPDALPYLGRLPGHENTYVVAGARGGYHLAPALGLLTAELIGTGETSVPIAAFDPGRLNIRATPRKTHAS